MREVTAIALAVCVQLDDRADAAVRQLWRRLEDAGVPTLMSHTHGRHLPHLTYASVRGGGLPVLQQAVAFLADAPPIRLHFDGLGTFRRTRCWLAPAVTTELLGRQGAVAEAVLASSGGLHRHYWPGLWLPHLTLAPRLHLDQLPLVAAAVYAILPIEATGVRSVIVETATGDVHLVQ